ncbi:MAG: GAF domain-containing SpoIIE family protein phosphatase [Verrucomicrobiota bacterium]|nr:GAF domain-containing SpoIIE family protein phosphatase [Verrucomicrobiota bacterium]
MLFNFLLGLVIGASAGWYFYYLKKRQVAQLDEEKLMLVQEKQIVLEFMHNLAESIGEGVTRDELLRRVVHAAVLSTGALSAAIFEMTPSGKLRGLAIEGLFPPQRPLPESMRDKLTTRTKFLEQVLRSEEFELGEGLIGSVAKTGQPVIIADARTDPRVVHHNDAALVIRSMIVVPMQFRNTLIGVLAIANPGDSMAFSDTDFSLGKSLAEQAAMAIHNLDLMALQIEKNKLDMDLSIASSVQGMLLPKEFNFAAGLDVDAIYIPAQKVGGDLYDIFPLANGRIGLAVADVSGKGISASLLMAICQSNLRHLAKSYDSPARVLTELNRVMRDDMRQDMFVTIIYAVIDMQAGELCFARAGHELPIYCHLATAEQTSPTVSMPGSEGMALGMVPTALFEAIISDRRLPFTANDVFVMYTDGLTERANLAGAQFSHGRLAESLGILHSRSASEINRNILESVSRFCGEVAPHDDITLLTIKRVG